jgi:phosphoribosylaminoimidazole (AIR) synthetase
MHADGAGTKSSLAYMYWKETGDISVWKVAQDALIMNIDDFVWEQQIIFCFLLPLVETKFDYG